MKQVNVGRVACVLGMASSLALAACGGNKSTNSTTSMGNQTRTESQREANALPLGQMARVPSGLHCGATRPVWVNTRRKTYHEVGDPYYGRTKNGQYMCANAAVSAGYHLAGTPRSGMRGSQHGVGNSYDNGGANNTDVNGTNNNMNGGYTGGRHRHRRHSSTY
ncbi:MAG: hypothetical protein GIW98_00025 [Candidatus Eremiobacteraeota bacterium]|nr:hypothetical protein [Candidatus Eremiobacteraeota bacterium]